MKAHYLKMTVAGCLLAVLLTSSRSQPQLDFGSRSAVFGTDGGDKRIDMDILAMEVESVLKILSDTSGWTIVPSQKVKGKVSLWSKGATARELLDKLSLVNSYVYRQEGNVIYLMTQDEYEQFYGPTSRTFSLKHQKAESIKPLLESSLTKAGTLGIDPWSNTIVVKDAAENLKKIELLISTLDQGFVQKRLQLTYAKAADVVRILEKMCPKDGSFEADARTNSIVVFNSQANVARITELVAQLDQDAVTRVLQIKFQRASEIASQISGLLSGRTRAGGEPNSSSVQQIVVSEATNQIIVTGSASEVNYITDLLEELDSKVMATTIPLKQLKAAQVLSQIAHLASKPENITVDQQTNRLIIRDNTRNIEQIRRVVQDLDESLVTKVLTLEYAMAGDIGAALSPLVTNPEAFQVEPRTNQVILCDSVSQVARMEEMIKKLDCKDAYFTRTYRLEHATASQVASVIESFVSRQRVQTTQGGRPSKTQVGERYGPADGGAGSAAGGASGGAGMGRRRTGLAMGSAPGLAGMGRPERAAATPSAVPSGPSMPSPQGPAGPAAAQAGPDSLGAAGTVVADDRSNTVTITETLATLTKVEQLIEDLDVPTYSYDYTFKYRQLESLELDSRLADLLRSEEDTFSLDTQTHCVHFTTIPSIAERILNMLADWDKPAKQALIRAKILVVSTSMLKDLGVTFESFFDVDGVDMILESSLPSQVGERAGALTVRKLTGTEYEAIIRAIESDSRSEILANPRILVLDGQSAEVRMATDEPFTETSIDSESGNTIENVRFLQVGTVLQVMPNIKEDNTIEMQIGLDVSSLTEIRNGIPVVNRNVATSSVAVRDDHVLMIGGLRFNRDINVREKVPILGDIPLIGLLFQSGRKQVSDTELVLFLQPTVVVAPEGEYASTQADDQGHAQQSGQEIADDSGIEVVVEAQPADVRRR